MAEAPPEVVLAGPIQDTWDASLAPLLEDELVRYFALLGTPRPEAPTLDALRVLQLAHLRAIPFENLNALLDLPVDLEPRALAAKMLSGERGGYCFEQNMLLAGVLVALGYDVALLEGRMLLGADDVRPRTHLALKVTPPGDEPRIVDVGFGRTTLIAPLPLTPGVVSELGGDRYRIVDHDGQWAVESARGDRPWATLYLLEPRPVYLVDVEAANHFVATHPSAYLKQQPVLLRPTAAGKRSLVARRFVVDEGDRQIDREIEPGEFAGLLRDEFGIVPPAPVDDVLR